MEIVLVLVSLSVLFVKTRNIWADMNRFFLNQWHDHQKWNVHKKECVLEGALWNGPSFCSTSKPFDLQIKLSPASRSPIAVITGVGKCPFFFSRSPDYWWYFISNNYVSFRPYSPKFLAHLKNLTTCFLGQNIQKPPFRRGPRAYSRDRTVIEDGFQ